MKPFNLEEAKAGKPVCTRSGDKVRIICFDCITPKYPIIALVRTNDIETIYTYTKEGKFDYQLSVQSSRDLMMADVTHEGYINIYKSCGEVYSGTTIHKTEKDAKLCSCDERYVKTILK